MRNRNLFVAALLCLMLCGLSCASGRQGTVPSAVPGAAGAADRPDFTPRVEQVGPRCYVAIGYALANSVMIRTDNGKVIIDATESVAAAQRIRAEFDRLAPGPVLALIYTHTHPDHVLGASVFHEPGAPIWAHAAAPEMLNDQFASLGATLRYRGAKQYGQGLDPALVQDNGIGPRLVLDPGPTPPLLYPTHTFRGMQQLEIDGVRIELHEAPGETIDQLFVWLPNERTLIAADDIYMAFPNLYSTRGVPPRPVRGWIDSLDRMRRLDPDFLIPCHTEPLIGRELIQQTLTDYRDAIAFVHDSVIRMANAGLTPDQMKERIELPPHLADNPFLRQSYGKLSWSVRGIYDGYLGWFDGNPTNLERLSQTERASRLVPLLGGREAVLRIAADAQAQGDAQWSAELCDLLLALDPNDKTAAEAKAAALWTLGLAESNSNARCFLLSSALELRGDYKPPSAPLIDAQTLIDVPVEVIIRTFPERLRPETTADVTKTIAFEFSDSSRCFSLLIRRGVGEVSPLCAEQTDLRFKSTESDFKAFLVGDLSPAAALATGKVSIEGGLAELLAFGTYLSK